MNSYMSTYSPLPPNAGILLESLRDIGYSLETAVADIIDNSISAKASVINISCNMSHEDPVITIVDNGYGMTAETLKQAMRHGSSDPLAKRANSDLGRFGLGLKTASFSQCRKLTVVSVQNGKWCGAMWDLDLVKEKNEWLLCILDEADIHAIPGTSELDGNGTLVIWEKIDRLFDNATGTRQNDILNEKLSVLREHLSLVFHRFIDGDGRKTSKVTLVLNNGVISAFDPFFRQKSEMLENEVIYLDDGEESDVVEIQPYIMPHYSRLTEKQERSYQSRSEYLSNQGIYVYRNSRLVAWGSWFRMMPKGESTKYARIQIDFSSRLDALWTIDIKKSSAIPPPAVRECIRKLLPKISDRSVQIHRKRGRKMLGEGNSPVWERYEERDGPIRYSINRQHPLVDAFRNRLSGESIQAFDTLLEMIATSLPFPAICDDYSSKPRQLEPVTLDDHDVLEKIKAWHVCLGNMSDEQILLKLVSSDPQLLQKREVAEQFVRMHAYE